MFLVWNDATSFRKHLEVMREFHQRHGTGPLDKSPFRDRALPRNINPSGRNSRMMSLTDARGNVIIVPIWKIQVLPGSQN
jgi:hypothetical protein